LVEVIAALLVGALEGVKGGDASS